MSEFTGTVEALLAGRTVNAALLITITWADDQVTRLWTGTGSVRIDDEIYLGAGELVSVDGLEGQFGTSGRSASFKLSGVDETIFAKAIDEADLVKGSIIECALQVFGDGELADQWAPVDPPVGLGQWLGDQISFERTTERRTLGLTGISFFENRSRPPASYYSDNDQQRRYPGDRGGEFMFGLASKTIKWPFNLY